MLQGLGKKNFSILTVIVLLISDLSLVFQLKSDLMDVEKGARQLLLYLPNSDLAFAREIYSLAVSTTLTALTIFLLFNLVNYFFFIRGKKFAYKYTNFSVKMSIPLTFYTAYLLSKKLDLSSLFHLALGFLFCLIAYGFRFYPYKTED